MKPRRILHVVSSLARGSGVMSVIMNIYQNLDKSNVQFDFIFFKDVNDSYENEITSYGGEIYKIPRPSIKGMLTFYSFTSNFFKENSEKYTALQIHEVYLCSILAPVAKRNGIKNIIAHCHNTMYADKFVNSIRNRVLCLPLKRVVDINFACSVAAGEFLFGKKAMRTGKVRVINNAIDCDKYKFDQDTRNNIRNELSINDKFVIGHVGRFNEQKNHTQLLDIFVEIKKIRSNSQLLLVGEGPLKDYIKEKAETLGISKDILFLGQRSDVDRLLQSMDVFIMPSLFEGLPVVGIEAQATGLLCYMSDEVTEEVSISNLYFKSLNVPPHEWANDIIENFNGFQRKNNSLVIKRSGFDIKVEAKKTENYYLELNN
ncbi:glycosyltransferase family 1 protein [Paenibacillus terrigena]|uniref:glycosyltransferase family 1 protein n=1 Tax=Paenibacillus terrigena TaxID=369333 RepID=UPI000360B30F|nr:glycosyltransferase family 1 protein [Paenibacillus terrigena]